MPAATGHTASSALPSPIPSAYTSKQALTTQPEPLTHHLNLRETAEEMPHRFPPYREEKSMLGFGFILKSTGTH